MRPARASSPGRTQAGGAGAGRRAVVVILAAVAVVLATPAPASAHGRGSDATNYDSRIVAEPAIAGAVWAVHGGDELLEVDSPQHEITVLGYSDEPYLRVGPDGVFENRNSPATYLNEDQFRTELPPGITADPEAPPEWERVSGASSYAWHDHRIHVMTTALPQQVAADEDTAQLVQEWRVPVVVEGAQHTVQGELHWVPGPSPWPWLLAGVLAASPALVGVRSADWRRLIRPAALVLAAVAALNTVRIVDDLFAMPLPGSTMAMAVIQTALFLAIGLFGAWRAWQGGDGAFTALGAGSAAILVGQGFLYLPALSASQLTSVFPDALGRFVVAASITQALAVGPVALIGNRRMVPEPDEDAEAVAARA